MPSRRLQSEREHAASLAGAWIRFDGAAEMTQGDLHVALFEGRATEVQPRRGGALV